MGASRQISDGNTHWIGFTSPFSADSAYTLMVWAKHEATVGLDALFNIRHGASAGNGIANGYFWSSGNGFIMQQHHVVNSGDTTYATQPSASVTVTNWHHWGIRWDGSSDRADILVDGVDVSAAGSAGLLEANNGAVVDIGRAGGGLNAAISVAHAQLHSIDLADEAIRECMWHPGTVLDSIEFYAPIYGSDSPELDLSGNAVTGTINDTCAEQADGPPVSIGNALPIVFGSISAPSGFVPYPSPRYGMHGGMQTQAGGMQ